MHGDLEVRDALRWITDILDFSQIPFILIGDLSKQLFKGEEVNVDKVEIGILKDCWNDNTKDLVSTFLMNTPFRDKSLEEPVDFEWNGVPIKLKIIKHKYEFFKNPDFVFYWTDTYKVPNPLDLYYRNRNLIK